MNNSSDSTELQLHRASGSSAPATQPYSRPTYRRRPSPRLVTTIHDTAKRMGVTELTVRRWIKAGRLHAVQVGGSWRIPRADRFDKLQDLPRECTLHQIANSLDVSDLTVRRWIKDGQLPALKRQRTWVIQRSVLESILEDTQERSLGS